MPMIVQGIEAIGLDPEGFMSVKEALSEWYRLTSKPYTRGGDLALFNAVRFANALDSGAVSAILIHSSKEVDDSTQILIAFTLGLWLGQSQKAILESQSEDLDS